LLKIKAENEILIDDLTVKIA